MISYVSNPWILVGPVGTTANTFHAKQNATERDLVNKPWRTWCIRPESSDLCGAITTVLRCMKPREKHRSSLLLLWSTTSLDESQPLLLCLFSAALHPTLHNKHTKCAADQTMWDTYRHMEAPAWRVTAPAELPTFNICTKSSLLIRGVCNNIDLRMNVMLKTSAQSWPDLQHGRQRVCLPTSRETPPPMHFKCVHVFVFTAAERGWVCIFVCIGMYLSFMCACVHACVCVCVCV